MTGVAAIDRHDVDRPEGDEESSTVGVGVIVWLASELMFFSGLFAAYFALRAENGAAWPPANAELDVLRSGIFTLVLITSSITVHFAVKASEDGRRSSALGLMVVTIVLGAIFLTNQGLEYAGLDFQLDSHSYGSIYYLLTGFHGLHVLGGLIAMTIIVWVVFSRYSRLPSTQTLRSISYYWHFVDVVWVAVFLVVYVIK
jgi:cytochrome c oxidase subunit 3